MANNALSTIRAALLTHLTAVTELQDVQSGRSVTPSGYPFARFYLAGVGNELLTNQPANFRSYRFAIDIVQEIANKDRDDAEADFQDAVDAVMDKLNAQWQVKDGSNIATVDVSQVEGGNVQQVEINGGPAVILTIQFTARSLIY